MAEHISSHFNQELENVRSEVMRMGGLVEARLQQVLAALDEGSSSGLTEVIDGDADINKLEVEIDDACQTIIARRQPAAGDLRFVLAVSRVIVDLERIGDEVKKSPSKHTSFWATTAWPRPSFTTPTAWARLRWA